MQLEKRLERIEALLVKIILDINSDKDKRITSYMPRLKTKIDEFIYEYNRFAKIVDQSRHKSD